jgi:phage-related protein
MEQLFEIINTLIDFVLNAIDTIVSFVESFGK